MERELRSLRNETETLVAELEASSAASGRLTEMPESAPTDADTEEDVDEELSALATADEVTPGDSTSEDSTSPEVREMIREQLVEIRDSGQERSEAESFLMRFTQGQRHLDLLDEIYDDQSEESRPSTSRRRRLRRRRAKQQSDDQE